jgi:hypothetical protein
MGLNGGKTLTRIALDDPGTLNTMTATARAINELAELKLMAMVEPFWSSRVDGKVRNDLTADAVIKSVGICAALGRTSAFTGLVVGRTLLYPADDDVAAAVDTAAAMVR